MKKKRRVLGKGDFFIDYKIKNTYGKIMFKQKEITLDKGFLELKKLRKLVGI